jgi:N-acetylglucosaminyl-diphospho-decaprenol L-rhamnosyltransferase
MPLTHVPSVSFIVVNYNGGSLLGRCLASIRNQTFADYEIIVVDNGSTDGSCNDAQGTFPALTFLRNAQNLGFAEANNRALQVAKGELIALINNDATLHPGWTQSMVDGLREHPLAGAAAGRTLQARNTELIDAAGFAFYSCGSVQVWRGLPARRLADPNHMPFGAHAAAALYRRSALDTVGHFHSEYFCYYEDTDLAIRLVLWGYPTIYLPEAIAYHLGSHSGKDRSDFHIYHLRRNIEYVYWVDMLGYLAWLNLPLHVAYESLALAGALLSGQLGVVLKAKRDAWNKRHWIAETRKKLAAELREQGKTDRAQANFWRAARFGLPISERLDDLVRRHVKK